MKRFFALLVAVVMCFALFTACGKKEEEKNAATSLSEVNKELNDVVIANVDGIHVSQAYYNFVYSQQFFSIAQNYQAQGLTDLSWLDEKDEQGKSGKDYLKERAEIQIKQGVMARVLAEENDIKLTDDMKTGAKNEVAQFLQENTQEFLVDSHTTEAALITYCEEQYIIEALIKKLSEEGGPAELKEEDIKEVEEMFNTDYANKLKVQHILIMTTDAQTGEVKRTDEEALKEAKAIVSMLDGGADFDSLIPEYNEDPGMTQGNYYVFGDGEMVIEFENASKALKAGQYTKEPVKTDYGYHIIKKYALDTTSAEFEQYKNYMIAEKVGQLINEKLAGVETVWEDEKIASFISTFISEQSAELAAMTGTAAN